MGFVCVCVCVCVCVTPQTIAHQAPLSTEFSRQEYWSGLPFPTPCIWDFKLKGDTNHFSSK